MTLKEFLKGNKVSIIFNLLAMILLSIFLLSIGNNFQSILMIIMTWSVFLICFYGYEYNHRKKYFNEIFETIENMDKRYLITEVIDRPKYSDAIPYYTLMKMSNKSMMEEISAIKNERKEYKEYVEQWIHEVKTPIASIKLIEENNKSNISREVLYELEKIDGYVEEALFYARSEAVEKDYLIKEISIMECVQEVIIKNKQMFIRSDVEIELDDVEHIVYSDYKWISFILNQIIINAVKYKKPTESKIKIYCEKVRNGVQLIIEDNGIGISNHEIARVFEKGFTGNIGRVKHKSTGIGLYLCKKLSIKLGVLISVESEYGEYTKVILTFPKGSFSKI